MKKYYIIAGVVVLACLALGASSFMSAMTPYVADFKDVRTAGDKNVQVPGKLVEGKTNYDGKSDELNFEMKDDAGDTLPVVYRGAKPSGFDVADQVVAVGRYRDGALHADKLLVKCPSKYKAN